MIKRESKFQTLFRHWLRANKSKFPSCAFELKQTTTDSLPFTAVAEHQEVAMEAAETEGILYKAPDDSRGSKPFDFFWLREADAWVVIRYPNFFCIISRAVFFEEKKISDRKSLISKRAKWIAHIVVEL